MTYGTNNRRNKKEAEIKKKKGLEKVNLKNTKKSQVDHIYKAIDDIYVQY
jgi:hypothetical protein